MTITKLKQFHISISLKKMKVTRIPKKKAIFTLSRGPSRIAVYSDEDFFIDL
jgi:hypothetical protein